MMAPLFGLAIRQRMALTHEPSLRRSSSGRRGGLHLRDGVLHARHPLLRRVIPNAFQADNAPHIENPIRRDSLHFEGLPDEGGRRNDRERELVLLHERRDEPRIFVGIKGDELNVGAILVFVDKLL